MSHRLGPNYKSHRLGLGPCLNCGQPLTGVGALGSAALPSKGDLMVCLYCSHAMEWSGEALSELSDEAIKEMAGDPEMLDTIKFTSTYQKWARDNPK